MTFEKNKTRQFFINAFIFLVGMFNVSISGVFGGYYGSVAAIIVVLATIYTYELFDKKINIKENIAELSLIGSVAFLNVLFFLVNDVFNIRVYTKNNSGFWSILVIISQLIAIGALVYTSVMFILNSTKEKIEIVDENQKIKAVKKDDIKNNDTENTSESEMNQEKTDETKVEIRAIEKKNENEKDPPFMEEEN